jgi:lipopolysaccharide/colanic/teichoic acid biosynthesis glycosyltransferase
MSTPRCRTDRPTSILALARSWPQAARCRPSRTVAQSYGRRPGSRLAHSAPFVGAAVAQDEGPLSSSLPTRTEWLTPDGPGFLVKRVVDLAGTLLGLLLLAPVMLAIALLIRLDSPGPVLFRQVRRGYRGRPFRMLKFRTMVADAERRLGDLESCNESAGGVLFKLRQDPRVTRLGRFLRRSSLDELPQLINVLKGEMSLVGPRPLQLRDSDRLETLDPQAYARRLRVLPGLTGPWQVGGRSDLDYQQMVQLDVDYVAYHSLGRDLWILGQTVLVVLLRRGAC